MDLPDTPTLVILAVVGVAYAVGVTVCLVDLRRRKVRHLPKWAWALIILLGSFPIGAIIYLIVGRVPPGEEDAVADRPPPGSAAPPPAGSTAGGAALPRPASRPTGARCRRTAPWAT